MKTLLRKIFYFFLKLTKNFFIRLIEQKITKLTNYFWNKKFLKSFSTPIYGVFVFLFVD